MKKIDFKSLAVIEVAILASIGFLSLDFLPRNHAEYLRICSQEWSNDATQYKICMQPYFAQTNFDRYAIGVAIAALVAVPVIYFFRSRKNSIQKTV